MPPKDKPCRQYDPWKTRNIPLNMAECFHFIPTSGRCDCGESEHYNNMCPWQGYPEDN